MSEQDRRTSAAFTFVAIAILLVWFFAPALIGVRAGTSDLTKLGQFGDLYGALSSLFSALAVLGVGYGIVLQRNELSAAKDGLKSQEASAAKQNKLLDQQSFENTLFQLLRLHMNILEEISAFYSGGQQKGRVCFQHLYSQFVNMRNSIVSPSAGVELNENLKIACRNIVSGMEQDFGHYLRSLQSILEFLELHGVQKKFLLRWNCS